MYIKKCSAELEIWHKQTLCCLEKMLDDTSTKSRIFIYDFSKLRFPRAFFDFSFVWAPYKGKIENAKGIILKNTNFEKS